MSRTRFGAEERIEALRRAERAAHRVLLVAAAAGAADDVLAHHDHARVGLHRLPHRLADAARGQDVPLPRALRGRSRPLPRRRGAPRTTKERDALASLREELVADGRRDRGRPRRARRPSSRPRSPRPSSSRARARSPIPPSSTATSTRSRSRGGGALMAVATERTLSLVDAVGEAMRQAMEADPTVIVMGEDVVGGAGRGGDKENTMGGSFGATKSLYPLFGAEPRARHADLRGRLRRRRRRSRRGGAAAGRRRDVGRLHGPRLRPDLQPGRRRCRTCSAARRGCR